MNPKPCAQQRTAHHMQRKRGRTCEASTTTQNDTTSTTHNKQPIRHRAQEYAPFPEELIQPHPVPHPLNSPRFPRTNATRCLTPNTVRPPLSASRRFRTARLPSLLPFSAHTPPPLSTTTSYTQPAPVASFPICDLSTAKKEGQLQSWPFEADFSAENSSGFEHILLRFSH